MECVLRGTMFGTLPVLGSVWPLSMPPGEYPTGCSTEIGYRHHFVGHGVTILPHDVFSSGLIRRVAARASGDRIGSDGKFAP
jgi:hypothetical protein